MAEDNSLLPSCSHNYLSAVSIACDSTIPVTTSKAQLQLNLSAISTHESLGTRLQSLLPLISLHFLLLIGFYFSEVHDDSNALRNFCYASCSDPLYTHTSLALTWLKKIFFRVYSLTKYTLFLNSLYILPPLYLSHLGILSIQAQC